MVKHDDKDFRVSGRKIFEDLGQRDSGGHQRQLDTKRRCWWTVDGAMVKE
uniref:Uncharacterized protein n=1 Tax=Cucumis melo TaxID=3656 RepID=A0A9I9DI21_CUCME